MAARSDAARKVSKRPMQSVVGPRWTMRVDNFGPVASAEIQMAPLVLLVGKNNTGKSYIASLLWMVLAHRNGFQRRSRGAQRRPSWFSNLIERAISDKADHSLLLGKRELDSLGESITQYYRSSDGQYLKDVFSYEFVDARNFSVNFNYSQVDIRIRWDERLGAIASMDVDRSDDGCPKLIYTIGRPRDAHSYPDDFTEILLYDHFVASLLNGFVDTFDQPIYIPAARTGLMLAFRRLVSDLLNNLSLLGSQVKDGTLPRPVIAFLQALVGKYSLPNSRFQKIAKELEEKILDGQVKSSKSDVPDFTYHPAGLGEGLPLHVTSSMVTELAPFLLLLKAGRGQSGLVFEEPEAHLHLSAQTEMAKAIARLVNAGVPVVVTTHSDTFVQKINNLIHLHSHPKRARLLRKLGLKPDELINPKFARAYEFERVDGRTEVSVVPLKEEGFAIKSLNEAIIDLATETLAIQDA